MATTDDSPHYTTWTPEQLMRDYHGELKRELFVRCMEWYTNSEVEAKINDGRSDGSRIKNPNFYAEFKRNLDAIALRDGQLPTEFRLQFDKRRFINLEARFGPEVSLVKALKRSIRSREAIGFPTLSANPSLKELEAARPDNAKKPQNGRETRDYWIKFFAATKTHTEDQIRIAYDMAPSTTRQEIARAKRIVARIKEIELIESKGGSVRRTYFPPDLLLPGQQIYKYVSNSIGPSLVVVLKTQSKSKTQTEQSNKANDPNRLNSVQSPTNSPEITTPTQIPLLSIRMRSTIFKIQNNIDRYPDLLHHLGTFASRFEPPIKYPHATERERQAVATCETQKTLADYANWCKTKAAEIFECNSTARLENCLSHIIRKWYDEVLEAEDAGVEELGETFLQVVMRRLQALEDVEKEVEDEAAMDDAWARHVESE